jgi:hypothetical protein
MPKNLYGRFTKNWSTKNCGPKPTAQELATAEALGFRPGSKVAFANGMYGREGGATGDQICAAVGKPQLNGRRNLVTGGFLQKGSERNDENKVIYANRLTAKGRKLVGTLDEEKPAEKPAVPITEEVDEVFPENLG